MPMIMPFKKKKFFSLMICVDVYMGTEIRDF